jgi:hypothetical protein
VVTALVVGAVVVIGRSGGTSHHALDSELLAVADLPSGWTGVPPTSPLDGTASACLGRPPSASGPLATTAVTAVAYRSAPGTPNVFEQLERYSPTTAATRWDELMGQALHGCSPTTGPQGGAPEGSTPTSAPASGPPTLPVLVRPREGDESATFSIRLSDGTLDTVFVGRWRGTIIMLQLVDVAGADPYLFDQTVSKAMTRILN